tara:strand:+ start:12999 stop:14690 length:1692 start_codon:yes stop_codon:yes gene_type:complete
VANTIQIKRSSTASDTPSASDLAVGEIAVNTADAKLFTKHTDGSIKELGGSGGLSAVVDDTSPQLGGNLDTNAFQIEMDDQKNINFGNLGSGFGGFINFNSTFNPYGNSNGTFLIGTFQVPLRLAPASESAYLGSNFTVSNVIETNNASTNTPLIVRTNTGSATDNLFKIDYQGTATFEKGVVDIKNDGSQSELRLYCESSNAHYASIKAPAHADFAGNITLTLPATTGTVLSTANADVATTTTSSSDADHVLINDNGVLKKITPTNLGIGSGGGGGSSTLGGLSDVTISSLQNNDLLKYNSTAGVWQNTNLGLTVDPALTFPANVFTSASTTVTVAPSSGSYDAVAYFAEVRNNADDTTLVTNANITKTATSLTFTAPSSAGTYKLRVKAQDFGDLESEFVVGSFTVGTAQPRYYRIYGSGGSSHTMVDDIEFFTGTGQSGTKYPDAVGHMTSNTAPTPLVASSSGAYSFQYEAWEAFDSSAFTEWWNLGKNSTYSDWYIQLDIGVFNVTLQSAKVVLGHSVFFGGTQDLIMKSSTTGAFSGEETTLGTISNGGASGTFNIN